MTRTTARTGPSAQLVAAAAAAAASIVMIRIDLATPAAVSCSYQVPEQILP